MADGATAAETFDLVVIGSGPAGEKGAAQAAYFGRRVAVVEREPHVGGAGVNTGTVPSKTLRETALYFSGLQQRGLYGIDYTIRKEITVPDFMYRKDEVVRSLHAAIHANLERHKVELVQGEARFEDPHTVRVSSRRGPDRLLSAPIVLIATGSYPNWPDGVPKDPRLWDSDTVLRMEKLPRSLCVVGGGVIGCEYATMFRAMGIEVTLVCGSDRIMPFLDRELGERLQQQIERLGLQVLTSDSLARVDLEGTDVVLRLKSGREVRAENALFATGRMGGTRGLGLEKVGLTATSRGLLYVNEHYQTAVPHIYAAGDVVGFPALASTSMEQARVAMCHAFDLKYKEQVGPILPMAVYTIPEIGAVGETEESLKEKGVAYGVGRTLYRSNSRGLIVGDLEGLVKMIFAADDRRLLGVHIIGDMASELVHVGMAVLHFKGRIEDFIQMVFNYPTLGEAYKYAAYDALGALARRSSES